jgi:Flp pilus assembly protein TadG
MRGTRFDLLNRFVRDERGNLAVIFAIAVIPLLTAVGCAVDYAVATRVKAKLQNAADAAAVGSVAQGAPAYLQAGTIGNTGPLSAGVTDAYNIFDANKLNLDGSTGFNNLVRTATVTKNSVNITSQVSFSADIPTTFVKLLGYPKLTVSGTSQAAGALPMFLDFYLLLDVSGSMGLPSTQAEAQRLQAINPDNYIQYPTGCTLACHFSPQKSACVDPPATTPPSSCQPLSTTNTCYTQAYPTNGYCLGYAISRVSPSGYAGLLQTSTNPNYLKGQQLPPSMVSSLPGSLYTALPPVSSCDTPGTDNCIQLRLDAVGYAVNHLLQTANNDEKVPQQFRIGLYPFIQKMNQNYAPLTASINGSAINSAAANLATLLDTNMDSNLGSGGTHIDTALSSVNNLITSVGTGISSSSTLPYVFLITDGAQDNQTKGVPNGGWSGSNHATVIDPLHLTNPTVCTTLKNRGIVVAVLYIPYQQINPVNAQFAGDEDDYANNNIPNIPKSLTGCASPNFFYTANTPQDIDSALKAMFERALLTAHITQ